MQAREGASLCLPALPSLIHPRIWKLNNPSPGSLSRWHPVHTNLHSRHRRSLPPLQKKKKKGKKKTSSSVTEDYRRLPKAFSPTTNQKEPLPLSGKESHTQPAGPTPALPPRPSSLRKEKTRKRKEKEEKKNPRREEGLQHAE